jgi:hypothetical protein
MAVAVVLAAGWNRFFDERVRTHLESILLSGGRRAHGKAD